MKVTKVNDSNYGEFLILGETDLDYCGFIRFTSKPHIWDIGVIDDIELEKVLVHKDLDAVSNKAEIQFNIKNKRILSGNLVQEFIGKQYTEFDLKMKLLAINAYYYHTEKELPHFIELDSHFNQSKIKNIISEFQSHYDELSFKSNVSNKFFNISMKKDLNCGVYPIDILGDDFHTQIIINPSKGFSLLNYGAKDLTITEAWDAFLFHQLSCFLVLKQNKFLNLNIDDVNTLKEYRCIDIPELFSEDIP